MSTADAARNHIDPTTSDEQRISDLLRNYAYKKDPNAKASKIDQQKRLPSMREEQTLKNYITMLEPVDFMMPFYALLCSP